MGQDLQTSGDLITRTTRACLDLAELRALPSLALPAFGTGVGGFPLEECARLMVAAIADFARPSPGGQSPRHLRRVVLMVYGPAAYDAFTAALRDLTEVPAS
jgi:O-acetyl-ADP-ribose deacetylase (regulator of RNase III)